MRRDDVCERDTRFHRYAKTKIFVCMNTLLKITNAIKTNDAILCFFSRKIMAVTGHQKMSKHYETRYFLENFSN